MFAIVTVRLDLFIKLETIGVSKQRTLRVLFKNTVSQALKITENWPGRKSANWYLHGFSSFSLSVKANVTLERASFSFYR